MSDAKRRRRSDAGIDISTNRSAPEETPPVVNWFIWFGISIIAYVVYYLVPEWSLPWTVVFLLTVFVAAVTMPLAWSFFVRRRIAAYLRSARAPAKAMAEGNPAAAEAAFQKALRQVERYALLDHRRGMMLHELAAYVKNQGRSAEAKAMYEESVDILGHHQRARPTDYFSALNNFAIYFIHLRDYAAAQEILEKVLDLTLLTKKSSDQRFLTLAPQIKGVEYLLQLNLVFLFLEMHELALAESHLEIANEMAPDLPKRIHTTFGDHHIAISAMLWHAQGRFKDAAAELAKAKNPDVTSCLRVRARLHLVRQEFADAEKCLHKYAELDRKKGSLHRPELRDFNVELAESLFGQGKAEEALASLQEALALVADFTLPSDGRWRQTLQGWLARARDLGRADMFALLDAEMQKTPAADQAIMILEKFRVRPRSQGGCV